MVGRSENVYDAGKGEHMIAVYHLYNDYSGSPKVLKEVLNDMLDEGYEVELITSKGGVLDEVQHPRLHRRCYRYKFSNNAIVTMLRYGLVQTLTFFDALRYIRKKDTTFYINTILPVGPALAGRLTGKKVVYHYHENAFVKSGFYRALAAVMERIADRIICVSQYQASFLKRKEGVTVVPNKVSAELKEQLIVDADRHFDAQRVLMLSSLKGYKGTREFMELAASMPDINWELVINDEQKNIDKWIEDEGLEIPENLRIYPRTDDVAKHYNRASIVMNLSDPRQFIETFGLTVIEARAAGVPVIVPEVGGIAELVRDGENGYKIDCRKREEIMKRVREMMSDKELYKQLYGED